MEAKVRFLISKANKKRNYSKPNLAKYRFLKKGNEALCLEIKLSIGIFFLITSDFLLSKKANNASIISPVLLLDREPCQH